MEEACDARQARHIFSFYPIPSCCLPLATSTSETLGPLLASIKKEEGGGRGGRG